MASEHLTYEELQKRLDAVMKENALLKEERDERLRFQAMILDQIADIITVTDLKGNITYVNHASARVLGKDRDSLVGQSVLSFGEDPERGATQAHIIEQTLAKGSWRGEVVNYDSHGKDYLVDCRTQVLRNEMGELIGMCGVSTDVTDIRNAQEDLRESERRYRLITDHVNDVVWQLNMDLRFSYVSPAVERVLGYTVDEALQLHVTDLLTPDGIAQMRAVIQSKLVGCPESPSVPNEYKMKHKNGHLIDVEVVSSAFLDKGGQPIGFVGVTRDITERMSAEKVLRESEKKYRTLFEMESDAMLMVDEDSLRIMDANTAAVRIYQYSKEELLSKTILDISAEPEKTLEVARERILRVPLRWQRKKDGTRFPVEITRSLLDWKWQGGRVHISAVRDISERLEAERKLREAQEQLFQAQKMETLGTLVAGVAHEINNPINLIMFNVPLLRKVWHDLQHVLEEKASKESDRKYGGLTYDFLKDNILCLLSDMEMASNRIAKVVTGLKDYARKSEVTDKRPMQLNTAVENALRLSQTTLKKSEVETVVQLEPDLPLIEGNPQNIEQIVLNFLLNANQSIDHDHGVIQVVTGFMKATRRVFISVSDNGRGIDPSVAERIFDPFVTTRQAEGGTGLGLSISYGLARAHKGDITFESGKEGGTTFTAAFPQKNL